MFAARSIAAGLAAALLLSSCAPHGSAIPARTSGGIHRTTQSHSQSQRAALCYAFSTSTAKCGDAIVLIPADANVGRYGLVVDADTHAPLIWHGVSQKWRVLVSGRVVSWKPAHGKKTSSLVVVPGTVDPVDIPPGMYCQYIICIFDGDTSKLPPGASQGSDGNWYNEFGTSLIWCGDCGADGTGDWLAVIGIVSTPVSVPYEGDLSPYLTAADFTNQLAPWFYGMALPLDVPLGAFLARFGGRFAARLAATRVGRVMTVVKAAVPSSNVVAKTAASVNEELAAKGLTNPPPFAPDSVVLDVVLDESTAASLNAALSGDLSLVRATTDSETLVGLWWTTSSSLEGLSASEIADAAALNYLPTNLVLGGQITAGSEIYVGITNSALDNPATGGIVQFFVKSGEIVGQRNVPIP